MTRADMFDLILFAVGPISSPWVALGAVSAICCAITIKIIVSATVKKASANKQRWLAVKSIIFVLCGLVAGVALWWSGEAQAGIIPVMAFGLGPAWIVVMYLMDKFAPELADYVRCKADFKFRCG